MLIHLVRAEEEEKEIVCNRVGFFLSTSEMEMSSRGCRLAVLLVAAMSAVLRPAQGYPSGAPLDACVTLTPQHPNTAPQTSPSPFQIDMVDNAVSYIPGTPFNSE